MAGIDSDLIRGHIDTIILKSLYRGDKYGLEILQEIEEKSGGTYEMKQPTLYSCLKRLETQGLISSYWEDSEIGGKRHYYTLTEKGRDTYKTNQEEWMRSRAIIDNLIYNTQIDYAPEVDEAENKNNAKNVQNGQNNEEINNLEENLIPGSTAPSVEDDETEHEEPTAEPTNFDQTIGTQQETLAAQPAENFAENEPTENAEENAVDNELAENIEENSAENAFFKPSSEDSDIVENETEPEDIQNSDYASSTEPIVTEPATADEEYENYAAAIAQDNEDDGDFALTNTAYTGDYQSEDNYNDDFATFDSANFSKPQNFFEANSEDSSYDDEQNIDNVDNAADDNVIFNLDSPISSADEATQAKQSLDDLVTFDDTILLGGEDEDGADNSDTYSLAEEPKNGEESAETNHCSDKEEPTTEDEPAVGDDDSEDLDAIYNPEPEIPEDEQIYTPPFDDDIDQANAQEIEANAPQNAETNQPISAPTYINFGNSANNSEADLTNGEQSDNEETNDIWGPIFGDFDEENTTNTADFDANFGSTSSNADNADANDSFRNYRINNDEPEQPSQPIVRASAEEINNMYKTTENYDNLQAGYTDETYKQMLNELEAYSSSADTSKKSPAKPKALSLSTLAKEFEAEGISVRRYVREQKENDDGKIYIKTNKAHMVKNWITFGIITFATILVFLIMNANKASLTYNFALWQFAVAVCCAAVVPIISTIKYLINPYKKVVAKYAPRLSILLGFLITIQLILIIYCINLQLGFYSFAQENYNHLLWIIPLILSFIPAVQSLVYLPLYQSKRYHV